MRLKTKLLLAQLPLLLALCLTGVVGSAMMSSVARSSDDILRENYRSVLAAERMKEAAERINAGALFMVAGHPEQGRAQIDGNIGRLENELAVERDNITEPGEERLAAELQAAWTTYKGKLREMLQHSGDLESFYFAKLEPAFRAVNGSADVILGLNQDAMLRKSVLAQRTAQSANAVMIGAAILGALLGLLSSATLTARLLRPLAILSQAARRIGEGDLAVRARVPGSDEVAAVAGEFNIMADHLETYRQSTLGELLEAQQAAQAAIDSLPDPVAILSPAGQVMNTNTAAGAVLNMAPGQSVEELSPDLARTVRMVRDHVLSGRHAYVPKGFEDCVRVPAQDGELSLLPRATPLYNEEGGVIGVTVVLQDVTRLLRLDELRSNMVATVAHEFRTPLTSLRMAVHLCLEGSVGPLTEKQADLLYAARQDCERLQGIVDEVLDLSRAQAGELALSLAPVPADVLVSSALEAQSGALGQHAVRLVADTLSGPLFARADAERLSLVFSNLIANAIRHSPPGAAVVVRCRPDDGSLRFEVVDDGPGIAPEYHARIFDRYFQVPGTPRGGAGLGLSIARDIVLAHGGQIGVQSEPGKGSTFWFTIPAATEQETAREPPTSRRQDAQGQLGNDRI